MLHDGLSVYLFKFTRAPQLLISTTLHVGKLLHFVINVHIQIMIFFFLQRTRPHQASWLKLASTGKFKFNFVVGWNRIIGHECVCISKR